MDPRPTQSRVGPAYLQALRDLAIFLTNTNHIHFMAPGGGGGLGMTVGAGPPLPPLYPLPPGTVGNPTAQNAGPTFFINPQFIHYYLQPPPGHANVGQAFQDYQQGTGIAAGPPTHLYGAGGMPVTINYGGADGHNFNSDGWFNVNTVNYGTVIHAEPPQPGNIPTYIYEIQHQQNMVANLLINHNGNAITQYNFPGALNPRPIPLVQPTAQNSPDLSGFPAGNTLGQQTLDVSVLQGSQDPLTLWRAVAQLEAPNAVLMQPGWHQNQNVPQVLVNAQVPWLGGAVVTFWVDIHHLIYDNGTPVVPPTGTPLQPQNIDANLPTGWAQTFPGTNMPFGGAPIPHPFNQEDVDAAVDAMVDQIEVDDILQNCPGFGGGGGASGGGGSATRRRNMDCARYAFVLPSGVDCSFLQGKPELCNKALMLGRHPREYNYCKAGNDASGVSTCEEVVNESVSGQFVDSSDPQTRCGWSKRASGREVARGDGGRPQRCTSLGLSYLESQNESCSNYFSGITGLPCCNPNTDGHQCNPLEDGHVYGDPPNAVSCRDTLPQEGQPNYGYNCLVAMDREPKVNCSQLNWGQCILNSPVMGGDERCQWNSTLHDDVGGCEDNAH